ncbi:Presenilin family protein [Brugia pahangi]
MKLSTGWLELSKLANAFAVLAPIGPLRRISEKDHEYSDQVLRFLMFTAEDRNDEQREEIEAKSKHIQQRKALGRKKKRNLKSTML